MVCSTSSFNSGQPRMDPGPGEGGGGSVCVCGWGGVETPPPADFSADPFEFSSAAG